MDAGGGGPPSLHKGGRTQVGAASPERSVLLPGDSADTARKRAVEAYHGLQPARELTLEEFKRYQHSHEVGPAALGRIHSAESFTTLDGPGIRYMLFLQGCAMRCLFCSNPDSLAFEGGTFMAATDVIAAVERVAPYLRPNQGGITLSGGEPMLQPTFVASLFDEVHKLGLTTCVDTNGQGTKTHHWDVVLPRTDFVLFCVKHLDPHKYEALTHLKQAPALAFAEEVARRGIPMWLRYVFLPGYTDSPEDIAALAAFAKRQPTLRAIELLPYHVMGRQKWDELGWPYPLDGVPLPTPDSVRWAISRLREEGLEVMCNNDEPTMPRSNVSPP